MSRLDLTVLGRAALALSLLALAPSPAIAGPPWISVEYPANPHSPETRGALLVLRAYHHGDQTSQPVSGTAVGMVRGKRQSIPLQLTSTSGTGAWAVRGSLPKEGSWVLVLNLTNDKTVSASALVALGAQRQITEVKVPFRMQDGWTIPRAATDLDVNEMLDATVATAPRRSPAHAPLLTGFGILLLIPAGLIARREARRPAD